MFAMFLGNKHILSLEHYYRIELELSIGLIAIPNMDSNDKGYVIKFKALVHY